MNGRYIGIGPKKAMSVDLYFLHKMVSKWSNAFLLTLRHSTGSLPWWQRCQTLCCILTS